MTVKDMLMYVWNLFEDTAFEIAGVSVSFKDIFIFTIIVPLALVFFRVIIGGE